MSFVLVTGPVRSGKSRFAERLAAEAGRRVTYVATAAERADDPEWCARIEHHRRRRPTAWNVIETAVGARSELREVIRRADRKDVLLVESLGTWLADRMSAGHPDLVDRPVDLERALDEECAELAASFGLSKARATIVVGEETGWGIVPDYASARVFRDVLGRLQRTLAARASRAYLVVNGFAIDVSKLGVPVEKPDRRTKTDRTP